MREGARNLPNKQVAAFLRVGTSLPPNQVPHDLNLDDDESLRTTAMYLISIQPVCAACKAVGGETVALCAECHAEWYCNAQCKEAHATVHQRYCCVPDGEWVEEDSVQRLRFDPSLMTQ